MYSTKIALEQLYSTDIWGINVTEALAKEGVNQIVISVWDEQNIGGKTGLLIEWLDPQNQVIESDVYLSVSELAKEFDLDVTNLKNGLMSRLIENLQSPNNDKNVMTKVSALDEVKLFTYKLSHTKP